MGFEIYDFKLLLFCFSLFCLASCSNTRLSWPPQEPEYDLSIVGPSSFEENEKSYQNVLQLGKAISEYVEKPQNKAIYFKNIKATNWFLKSDWIDQLWNLLNEFEKPDNTASLEESPARSKLIEHFEEHDIRGYFLAIRISNIGFYNISFLEGYRIIYLSDDEVDVNRFLVPLKKGREVKDTLITILDDLITTDQYASPSFGPLGFVKLEEGCFVSKFNNLKKCTDTFYLGRYPVTQSQWHSIVNPTKENQALENKPIVSVSYHEVIQFIDKLNKKSDYTYRLPTGIEWIFACQGDNSSEKEKLPIILSDVKHTNPNHRGFYDLKGNSWELTNDQHLMKTDKSFLDRLFDSFLKEEMNKPIRGGSYASLKEEIDCYSEKMMPMNMGAPDVGFRLVWED